MRRIAFASSAAVYGAGSDLPLREAAGTNPLSPYGTAKLASEGVLADLVRAHPAISTVALRYFNVYGPRQDPHSPYSGVISLLAAAFREGRPFALEGDGGQTRDFIAVADVARANVLALTQPVTGAPVVNVCTGTAIPLTEVIRVMETSPAAPSIPAASRRAKATSATRWAHRSPRMNCSASGAPARSRPDSAPS